MVTNEKELEEKYPLEFELVCKLRAPKDATEESVMELTSRAFRIAFGLEVVSVRLLKDKSKENKGD